MTTSAIRLLSLLTSVLISCCQIAVAQDEASPPDPIIPKELTAYADPALTFKNAASVISLLATADIERWIDRSEVDGKTTTSDLGLSGDCDIPEHQAFYRGMHMAHAGYYLFIAKQEVRWFYYQSPFDELSEPRRKFVDLGRGVLARLWQPARIIDVRRILSELARLPKDRRQDLIAFLAELREYRNHVTNLLGRAEGKLLDLLRRSSSGYYHDQQHHLRMSQKGIEAIPEEKKALIYSDLSAKLRELINITRDPDRSEVSHCRIMEYGFIIKFGVEPKIASRKIFTPVKYMVGFWLRRKAEGIEALADYTLGYAIDVLQGSPDLQK